VTGLTSISAEDPTGMAEVTEVYGQLYEFITIAMDDDDGPDRTSVVRVIGEVWLATLMARVRGWAQSGQMADDLEAAVRLLIPTSPTARRAPARARA